MWGYRNRLWRDLERWRGAGWITADGEAAIRADVLSRGHAVGLPGVLAILSAVLIGFAVMSFVAANWQDMPRLARLGLLTASLWAAYAMADQLFRRGMAPFGHAAVLLGCSVFGASIMLVSQMYHMDGNAPDAVLLWAIGTFLAGVLLRSNPALAFALVIFSIWGVWETGQREHLYWPYLIAWALVAAAFYWQRWEPGVHLAGLALSGFIVLYGYVEDHRQGHELVVAAGTAIGALSALGLARLPHLDTIWRGGLVYALLTVLAGLWALQFVRSPDTAEFAVLAAINLAITLAAIWWGLLAPDRLALWLGYFGFSFEILGIYGRTVGTLMGSSVFFLTAGFLVAGLAYFAYRLHARPATQETTT
jgi:uncharacterized membrane protein